MPWHAVAVHWPIALVVFAVAVDLAALVRGRPAWHGYAWITHAVGTVGAGVAVVTGNLAAAAYRQAPAAAAVQDHEDWATVAFLLCLVTALGRLPGVLRDRRAGATGRSGHPPQSPHLWIAVAVVAAGLLLAAGHRGGILVYELGVGVSAGAAVPAP